MPVRDIADNRGMPLKPPALRSLCLGINSICTILGGILPDL